MYGTPDACGNVDPGLCERCRNWVDVVGWALHLAMERGLGGEDGAFRVAFLYRGTSTLSERGRVALFWEQRRPM